MPGRTWVRGRCTRRDIRRLVSHGELAFAWRRFLKPGLTAGPRRPSTHLAAVLNAYADPESANAATVWRFTPTSIRRALDTGHTARRILDGLAAITTSPLPQPYLITDTARTHGRLRRRR